ncbi:MAG TPA: hypothetical protein VNO35_02755 [Steroidobacteraceae bacterium]|nr:hypothetical protein [Steroidobacteraceae bacterium]
MAPDKPSRQRKRDRGFSNGLGTGLQPEKSVNYSLVFVFRRLPLMGVTLDLYRSTPVQLGSAPLFDATALSDLTATPTIQQAASSTSGPTSP